MSESYDSAIRAHYRGQAKKHGSAASSTMEDERVRQLETELVLRFVDEALTGPAAPKDAILCDVGCGNGNTLAAIRARHPDLRLVGVEYTPELLALAQARFEGDERADIRPGDIREPIFEAPNCDLLLCQRVVINLLDPDDQKRALANLSAAVNQGGSLLFIEAFQSGLDRLNDAREEFGLPPLPPADHNLYLDDGIFDAADGLLPLDHPEIAPNFLSTHYFVSRVLHAAYLGDRPFVRNSHFVRFLSQALAPAVGDYAPLRALAFRKA